LCAATPWKSDDPEFEKLSVLDLCVDYFFHASADGPVCHRVAVLKAGGALPTPGRSKY
jgi:hypothetical protein